MKKHNNINWIISAVALLLLITAPIAYSEHTRNLEVSRLFISESILGREPAGATKVFSSDLEKVYCFLEARNITRDTVITFAWYYGEKEVLTISLPVREGARWRTYSSKKLAGLKGDWMVVIRDSNKAILGKVKFIVE